MAISGNSPTGTVSTPPSPIRDDAGRPAVPRTHVRAVGTLPDHGPVLYLLMASGARPFGHVHGQHESGDRRGPLSPLRDVGRDEGRHDGSFGISHDPRLRRSQPLAPREIAFLCLHL